MLPLRNYLTTLTFVKTRVLIDFIVNERENHNLSSFETWINSRYIDDTGTLSPVKVQTPARKFFWWLKREPSQNQTLDGLEGVISEWKATLKKSMFDQ